MTRANRSKTRLDLLLLARGLAPTRERARALILAGHVSVDGDTIDKAGTAVANDAAVTLRQPDHPWVGRGGLKLAHALETFRIDVANALALDIGASTGGFTDVLLSRGARRVVAIDVGAGQLDWRLRTDPRVVALEGINARYLLPDDLPPETRCFDIITVDVSFISLHHILPQLPALAGTDAAIIVLVKPQFEVGRDEVGAGGIVRDPALHDRVVATVTDEAHRVGLVRRGLEASPVTGAGGNREFLMWLTRTR